MNFIKKHSKALPKTTITKSLYPSGRAENYFLTKPAFYIEESDLAVVDKPRIHINTNKDIVIVYDKDLQEKIP